MEVLCLLADADGAVLSRGQIMERVWAAAVVNEEALTRVISDIRRALGDERSRPRYIETIPKRGYRLVAGVIRDPAVFQWTHEEMPTSSEAEVVREADVAARPNRFRRWRPLLGMVAAVCILTIIVRAILQPADQDATASSSFLDVSSLTSDPGQDAYPAFSTDGTRIAFSRRASDTDLYHLFVKQPRQAHEIQLTEGSYDDRYPAWSPDGGTIAFVRIKQERRDICTMPSLGGPIRVIRTFEGRIVGLDWSPNGISIALAHAPSDGVFSIFALDLETGLLNQLTQPLSGSWGDVWPRYSLAGDRIAFIRSQTSGRQVVGVVPAGGGQIETVPCDLNYLRDIDWYPGDRYLLVSATGGDRYRVWRLNIISREQSPIVLPVDQVLGLSMSASTGMLVIQVSKDDTDLIRYYLNRGTNEDGTLPGDVLFPSTQGDYLPAIDPAGSRIAFCSERTGEPQIFLANVGGGDVVQLTDFSGIDVFHLSWSPDSSRLLIGGQDKDGSIVISMLDPEGGQSKAIPLEFEMVDRLVWSTGGEWIHFNSSLAGHWRSSKIRPNGSDLQVVRNAYSLIIHQDKLDGSLFFLDLFQAGLRRLDPDGIEHLVSDNYPPTLKIRGTASRGNSIFYIADVDKRSILFVHDLATGQHDTLGTFARRCSGPLALYPDGGSLLVTATTRVVSDLALVPIIP